MLIFLEPSGDLPTGPQNTTEAPGVTAGNLFTHENIRSARSRLKTQSRQEVSGRKTKFLKSLQSLRILHFEITFTKLKYLDRSIKSVFGNIQASKPLYSFIAHRYIWCIYVCVCIFFCDCRILLYCIFCESLLILFFFYIFLLLCFHL
jgi:hypothetical protein